MSLDYSSCKEELFMCSKFPNKSQNLQWEPLQPPDARHMSRASSSVSKGLPIGFRVHPLTPANAHARRDVSNIRETFGGPYNKDYGILGSILGSPHLGKQPERFLSSWPCSWRLRWPCVRNHSRRLPPGAFRRSTTTAAGFWKSMVE